MTATNLVLASASPRRRQLLEAVGIPHDVVPADVVEPDAGSLPAPELAVRSALLKARAVANLRPGRLVLGADTVVALDGGVVLGKPSGPEDARRMLRMIEAAPHQVLSGVALVRCTEAGRREASRLSSSEVEFTSFGESLIERYVATGEPLDKAGAYGAQGLVATHLRRLEGSWANVVGLPLEVLPTLFRALGEDLASWQSW